MDERRPAPRPLVLLAVLAVLVATLIVVLLLRDDDHDGSGPAVRTARFGGEVTRLVVDDAPGKVVITGRAVDRVTVTDRADPGGRAWIARGDRPGAGVLHLSWRCDAKDGGGHPGCQGGSTIELPRDTALQLRQHSGDVTLTGLGGDVTVDASNVSIAGTDLRPAAFGLTLTSGHLAADFAAAPANLGLYLSSAQVTAHLPGTETYRVTSSVASGFLRTAVPTSDTSGHAVSVTIHSGEAELLPSASAARPSVTAPAGG